MIGNFNDRCHSPLLNEHIYLKKNNNEKAGK
jgi:hypothetical protein